MSRAFDRLPWVGVVCALVMLGGCGGAKARFAQHLQRGEQYLSAGVLDKASVEFRNALQIEPHAARALYLNGVVADRRSDLREAVGYYHAALDVNSDYREARAALARALVLAGAAKQALPIIEAGLARHRDDPPLLTARAAARAQLDDVSSALADAQLAVRLAPDDEDAVSLLAALYQRRGDTSRALDLVTATVTRKPASLALRQVLASLYLAAHDVAHSEQQLQAIMALAPKELPPRYQLAALYQSSGKLDAARNALEQAVTAVPGNNQPKLVLADFLFQQRSHEEGEKLLQSYLSREPGNQELRLELARLLERAGAAQQAVASLRQVIAPDPRSAYALTARNRIAAIEFAAGQTDAAGPELAAVLEQNPRDATALLLRSQIALTTHNPAAAIVDLRAVLRDQPNALDVQRRLARAYLANGDLGLAEGTLRSALASAAANQAGTVRRELAELLLQRGRADEAVTSLEEGVSQAPRDAALRELLVRAYIAKHDLTAAHAAADELKTLEPAAAVGPYLAGGVAEQQGHLDEARREFEHALELEPHAIEALIALTRLQLTRGQGAGALARVRAAASADANDPAILNLLGEVLIATKSYGQAIAPLTRATQLAPKWPLPYRNLASADLASGDSAGAEAAYRSGLKETASDPVLASGLALLCEQQGHVDQAIALYEALHAHEPRLEVASNNLAMLLVTYRSDQASLQRARELTAGFATSESGALLDTYGWVRLKLGDLGDALAVLERAASRAPESRVVRYHLAMAELKAGERDKARMDLETALTGAVRFAGSDDARATLNALTAGDKS